MSSEEIHSIRFKHNAQKPLGGRDRQMDDSVSQLPGEKLVRWMDGQTTQKHKMWVNTGSGKGLLPDGTKPLPEPSLMISQHWFR